MELPRLEPLYKKYKERGFEIVAVEATRNRSGAQEFIQKNNLTYHFIENGKDDQEVVTSKFGVTGFPTSFLIDRSGKVVGYHLGFSEGDEKKIEKEIQDLL